MGFQIEVEKTATVTNTRENLTREMRKAGFSQAAIDAAWPSWWTDEAEASPSSRAELRFALSRRLGLSPKPLLGERVEFFWNDTARFKHLRAQTDWERSTIASFGIALGRELIEATPEPVGANWRDAGAIELRKILLRDRPFVDLRALVATCWSFGIPIIHLNIVPLASKSMHAMAVQHRGRFAILLAHKVHYPAQAAFTVAHELGHILLKHLGDANALVDLEDPAESHDEDEQEREADEFALNLLTGTTNPIIEADREDFNAPMLADAAMRAAGEYQVEPGTIALSLAYRDRSWARTMSALKFIYDRNIPVSRNINELARRMLNWDALSDDAADYLKRIMADPDA